MGLRAPFPHIVPLVANIYYILILIMVHPVEGLISNSDSLYLALFFRFNFDFIIIIIIFSVD